MAKPLPYDEVIRRLKKHDSGFQEFKRRGKGSHRMITHENCGGQKKSFPLKHHGKKTEIQRGSLRALIRQFNLPSNIFD